MIHLVISVLRTTMEGSKIFGSAQRKCFFIEKAEQKQERGSMQRGIRVSLRHFVDEFYETCFDFVNLKKANYLPPNLSPTLGSLLGREQGTEQKG